MSNTSLYLLLSRILIARSVETGSICHFDDPAILLASSPQPEALSSSKQTYSRHDSVSPIPQGSSLVVLRSDHTKRKHLPRKTADVMNDELTTPFLSQETDDGDDPLDLLKRTSPPLAEPNRRPAIAMEQQPSDFNITVDEGSHVPPANSQTERNIEIAVPILESVSSQPVLQSVTRNSLVTSKDPQEQFEEALPHRAAIAASAAHKAGDFAVTRDIFIPETSTPTKKTIVVVTSQPLVNQEPDFTFPKAVAPQSASFVSKDPPQRLHQFQSDFTLPPLKSLNPDYKKLKSLKRRREAGVKEGRKDDWVPMGLNKWAATVNANPVWKKVSRASKCLTTREWVVCGICRVPLPLLTFLRLP